MITMASDREQKLKVACRPVRELLDTDYFGFEQIIVSKRGNFKIGKKRQSLRELRKAMNLTQKQVAFDLGVTEHLYAKWEKGDIAYVKDAKRVGAYYNTDWWLLV